MDFFTAHNILVCLFGVSIGTLVGVLPSISPSTVLALSLPILSLNNDATTSLIFLSGIIYGAQYGGSTTSIMLNLPGEATSLMTTIDGYKLTKMGRSKLALYAAGLSSFIGGIISVSIIFFCVSFISKLNEYFSAPDFLIIILISCYCIISFNDNKKIHNFQGLLIGFVLTYIGEDSFGNYRYNIPGLEDGLNILLLTVCMFGIVESISNDRMSDNIINFKLNPFKFSELYSIIGPSIRSSVVGSLLGIIPFFSQSVISVLGYNIERKFFNKDNSIGNGSIKGVAAAEAANNASAQTSLIPLLSMGIPSNGITTMVYVSLISCGVVFNPNFNQIYPKLYDTFIWSIIFGNIILLFLNTFAVNLWIKLLQIPNNVINPIIIIIGLTVAYSLHTNQLILVSIGVLCFIGILFKYAGYSYLPIIIGFLLGKQLEEYTYRTIKLFNNHWLRLLEQPMVVLLVIYIICVIVFKIYKGKSS